MTEVRKPALYKQVNFRREGDGPLLQCLNLD